jgi:hypothetical protein
MKLRNEFIATIGQEAYPHICNICFHIVQNDGPPRALAHLPGWFVAYDCLGSVHAAITDGITIGHPCCSIHTCSEELPRITACFCNTHQDWQNICAV